MHLQLVLCGSRIAARELLQSMMLLLCVYVMYTIMYSYNVCMCVCVPVDCTVVYRIYHTNTVLFSDVLFRGKKNAVTATPFHNFS